MSRSPTEVFRNPRTPGRKRKGTGESNGNGNGAAPGGLLPYDAPRWMHLADKNKQGHLKCNLTNAVLAIDGDPLFEGLLGFNQFERSVDVLRPLKGFEHLGTGWVSDQHLSAVQMSLQRLGMPMMAPGPTLQAVVEVAHRHAFHPIRDWLDGLAWDGEHRLGGWLQAYLGADHTPYTAAIGRMFLIAMVARVCEPGCKADYMLVLEHEQGAEKSTACKILAGGDQWFSDSLPDLHRADHVRVSMHLRGKWLIEVAEMSAIRAAEAAALKAFLTTTTERFTAKFARTEGKEPRQCLFVGTTNKGAYLRDETGGRRFWPVKCGLIDAVGLTRDREQLFAEAVDAYRRGENWWPEREFEITHIQPEQDDRYEGDDGWQEPIAAYIDARSIISINEIAREALQLITPRIGTADQRRITNILERLGWERGTRTKAGTPWLRHDKS